MKRIVYIVVFFISLYTFGVGYLEFVYGPISETSIAQINDEYKKISHEFKDQKVLLSLVKRVDELTQNGASEKDKLVAIEEVLLNSESFGCVGSELCVKITKIRNQFIKIIENELKNKIVDGKLDLLTVERVILSLKDIQTIIEKNAQTIEDIDFYKGLLDKAIVGSLEVLEKHLSDVRILKVKEDLKDLVGYKIKWNQEKVREVEYKRAIYDHMNNYLKFRNNPKEIFVSITSLDLNQLEFVNTIPGLKSLALWFYPLDEVIKMEKALWETGSLQSNLGMSSKFFQGLLAKKYLGKKYELVKSLLDINFN